MFIDALFVLHSARPGRPPKRTSSLTSTEVALEQLKRSKFTNFGDFYAHNRLIGLQHPVDYAHNEYVATGNSSCN